MPQIVMAPAKGGEIDGSVKKQAFAFLEKLSENDAQPGLHIEPIGGSIDPRVRTGRVNDFYRAVLFKVQGHADEAHYVYIGIWPHDEAIAVACKSKLTVNPVNGIAELITVSDSELVAASAVPAFAAAEPAPVASLLDKRGFDLTSLTDELGIEPRLAAAALAATSEDEILSVIQHAVQWQGLALIDLAAGTPMSTVMTALGIGVTEDDEEAEEAQPEAAEVTSEDDELLAALQHPAAKLQFAFIEDNDELRQAVEDADFGAWRVFLHPEQRKYATKSYKGPFRLSGGAGTGKTVVLLHRARHLARQDPSARILLTTFTRNLAESMQNDLRRLDPTLPIAAKLGDPGVHVAGIDAAARAIVTAGAVTEDVTTVLGVRSPQISKRTAEQAWTQAGASVPELPEDLRSRAFLGAEYAMVVLPARVTARDDYLVARRPGRGVALDRKKRLAVWSAIEAYRSRASIEGSIDFAEVPAIAAAHLERTGPVVDRVLVDEGQDLTPAHWQFLRALVAPGPNDLFIAEDAHQRIYGQPVVLGRYGIQIVGRSQRLRLNYRTTAENLRYGIRALQGVEIVDLENEPEIAEYRSARSGPAPRIIHCDNLSEEFDAAASTVRHWIAGGIAEETIGILARDAHQADQVARGLADRGVPVRVVDQSTQRTGRPLVMTMHRAKGMEFSCVLLVAVNAGLVPADYVLKGLGESDRADALARERSLLYVAMTRARDALVVTTSGPVSEILPNAAAHE